MKRSIHLLLMISLVFIFAAEAKHPNDFYTIKKELKVLSFNAWMVKKAGISISSKLEEERLPLIVRNIKELNPDIVALQEVWNFPLRDKFIDELSEEYPHHFYRDLIGMGDGMILFSKYPIIEDSFEYHVFDDGTAIEEWHLLPLVSVQKGVHKLTINFHDIPVDIFTFHLGAVYFEEDTNDYNQNHMQARKKQLDEMQDFIQENINTDRPTILTGDLNTHFFDWDANENKRIRKKSYEYAKMVDELNLVHSYFKANDIDLETTPMEELAIYTFDTKKNQYAGGEGFFSKLPSEFIDYIFYYPHPDVEVLESNIVFTKNVSEIVPGIENETTPHHLSDHWGVSTTFMITSGEALL